MLTIKFWQNGCQLVSTCSKKLSFYSRQLCCVCTFVWICCRKLWIFDELLWSQGYSCFVDSFLLYFMLIVSKPSSPNKEILSLKSILHSIREQKSNFTAPFVVAVAPGKKQCFALYRIHCTGQTMHQLFIKWQTTFCVSLPCVLVLLYGSLHSRPHASFY